MRIVTESRSSDCIISPPSLVIRGWQSETESLSRACPMAEEQSAPDRSETRSPTSASHEEYPLAARPVNPLALLAILFVAGCLLAHRRHLSQGHLDRAVECEPSRC